MGVSKGSRCMLLSYYLRYFPPNRSNLSIVTDQEYRKSNTGQGPRVGLCISTVWMAPIGEPTNLHNLVGTIPLAVYVYQGKPLCWSGNCWLIVEASCHKPAEAVHAGKRQGFLP